MSIPKLILIIIPFLFLAAIEVSAHPPSEIKLNYDPASGLFNIVVHHVSSNLRSHHIRAVSISINNKPMARFAFPSQTSAAGLVKEVPLTLKPGDVVAVKVFCTQAGPKEATIIIFDESQKENQPPGLRQQAPASGPDKKKDYKKKSTYP